MAEIIYERINEYSSVKISLSSPEDIRGWSYGEVKKPETINYRTYRAEKDGLFCERIFGPERNWECFCGKYKGIKHKGIVCDRCGVKLTHSRVRRRRMGHINLAAPIVHIWFFKAMPSRLGTLLGMKTTSLERIIYFQGYVVIDPGSTTLKEYQVLSEEEYKTTKEKFGEESFVAAMGAEAIRMLLQKIDLVVLSNELREELGRTRSKQRAKEIIKRLEIVEAFRDSDNKPEWMVLSAIPVIPPDLRPLVLLESGNFASSDLNDLYRRIINRNNRLKKLIDLNAPEVIIRNEKRMLQQAVDALFDNTRGKRPVLGSNNRPLKSLTDMIKGKQGRFRENLLGKRVDYSARSVIVVGPELKLHQCGLPKKIALELFQPFIIRRLREFGYADTIKSAKKMLSRKDKEVWDILEEVVKRRPVLLNRAPTLHRMGIQAFEPILVEGNAIKLHPLVCRGFNADFDGDQMAVHLPLSIEAQTEAITLMLSTNNIFSPASGEPIIVPSQDIVLGCYYLTASIQNEAVQKLKRFSGNEEVIYALSVNKLHLHDKIEIKLKQVTVVNDRLVKEEPVCGLCETTAGRVVFNSVLPEGIPFYNYPLDQKGISRIIQDCYKMLGREKTITLLDDVKEIGFKECTKAGLSFSISDVKMPEKKSEIIDKTQLEIEKIQKLYKKGVITEGERYNQIIDAWTYTGEKIAEEMMGALKNDTRGGIPYLNPVYLMSASGARGSSQQLRQLAGMRGLMAKPSGKIIETPIKANFREGLGVLEYFSSTHGARKGLADTALKTADSGYLTRKLADVAQNVVITSLDCGTKNGITKSVVYRGEKVEVPLSKTITGRVARNNIVDLVKDEVIIRENDLITEEKAKKIEALGYEKIKVRSPFTCEMSLGLCSKCYGMDLSRGGLVEEGMAVGIIAAQSIGEPGTQLTMKTFHIGGTATRSVEASETKAKRSGKIKYHNLNVVKNPQEKNVAINSKGEILIIDAKERQIEKHSVVLGAEVLVKEGDSVAVRQTLTRWDPHMVPILAEMSGSIRFEDIEIGKTVREESDASTGFKRKVIMEHKGDLHPQIIIEDENGKISGLYPIPEKAHLEVEEGEKITPGTLLAKTPREISRTEDITGGLPRVAEICEARKPKDPAVMSEIEGVVELGEKRRGKRTIIVRGEGGMESEHLVPRGKHLKVHRGDLVKAGDPLVEGPLVLQDILRIRGEEELQTYMLKEVQNVYRSQNVPIDDKHIEIIIGQMLRKVKIEDAGDTNLLPGQIMDKFKFREENKKIKDMGGKPSTAKPLLLGITRASLQADSFISAASFQETTKVLTRAALEGKVDNLVGLKENVILGHLVPAGTGYKSYNTLYAISTDEVAIKEASKQKEELLEPTL
ncbi:MAG: DNA-directed RNA polymerase subunit beta' [Candidatus Kuenenia stuttgartiensis]|jgi:DNA-directed RNA polymerase subunit beta'|uniref:DNA-directed RNA polymerase subunit beta' n=1 Tax=Kuenenia stuttgartiensis TaxID=174633 RepID=A0A2C9CHX7_KUEST|nr:DNA-directed RNA polymerase subunit beta' [Candidatus Kuenenia stuttgartiensis]MBZ0190173.1 DNA-directed RNA polymerase subunit beta' [Candidatus Kuenenia stuttgartiensis]MCF6152359.1 DNA-directed RNA polymerase subunit beta' [Candidatus Kuenenia stuttgartiensis]MCL4726144.1 DNA-directed RNA polymerase subunit beta' [Candidatus Kuenenia stuttgartiensis]TVM01769.1 MAG: DNA-directed RNA polymerase subunit beta' [Candidatus Kuenenia stuttgartiensis]SOH05281.1 strongly similar to DNA-directed R